MRRLLAIPLLLALALGGCAISPESQAQAALDRIDAVAIPDLQQAYDLAVYNGNQPAMDCWGTIIPLVRKIQARPNKVIGAATGLQVFMDLSDPGATVRRKCAAFQAQVKDRVRTLIADVAVLVGSFGTSAL